MEKDPERRYPSASALADDIRRHLHDEPVVARPPSRAYRVRKFVRRHAFGVSLAAALLAGLVTTAVGAGIGLLRAERAEARAEARRDQAESLITFMLGDLRPKLADVGRLDILSEVGARALDYFASVPEAQLSDAELARRSQALYQLGDVRIQQGDLGGAAEAMRESLALAQGLAARDPDNSDRLFDLGQSHFWVGYVAWRRGDLDAAERSFRSYLQVSERLIAQDPRRAEWIMELSFGHSNLGFVQRARGDLSESEGSFRSCLESNERAVALDPSRLDWRQSLASTHNALGSTLAESGRLHEALAEHRAERRLLVAPARRSPPETASISTAWRSPTNWIGPFAGGSGRLQRCRRSVRQGAEHLRGADPDRTRRTSTGSATWR